MNPQEMKPLALILAATLSCAAFAQTGSGQAAAPAASTTPATPTSPTLNPAPMPSPAPTNMPPTPLTGANP
jgi:hypothetical protein